jgi:PKD repeat protein
VILFLASCTPVEQEPSNKPPIAVLSVKPTSGIVPLEITVDGSNSIDPDGTIVKYEWDFGDGTKAYWIAGKHTYTTAGTFNLILTVTDNFGDSIFATKEIKVFLLQL